MASAAQAGAAQHARFLHPDGARGKVFIAQRTPKGWREHPVEVSDLEHAVRHLDGAADTYLSQNRFFGRRRRVAQLYQLDALFSDLDIYRSEYADRPHDSVLFLVLKALEDTQMPSPSFVVHTGRGLALVWLHDPVPRAALPRWRLCQQRICQILAPFGADPMATDAARVLRLIGTVNSKSGVVVHPLTPFGAPWPFDALADEILPLARAKVTSLVAERARRRAKGHASTVPTHRLTAATLWETRLTDLQRLRAYRWAGELPTGQRDSWLFVASVAMTYLVPANILHREVIALAAESAGWSEAEARQRMSSVIYRAEAAARGESVPWAGREMDPRYRLKTDWIIDRLEINEAEMRSAGLRSLVSPDVRRDIERIAKAAQRRAAGALPRAQYERGSFSRLRPWEAEGISRATYYRRIRRGETGVSPCMVAKPAVGGDVFSVAVKPIYLQAESPSLACWVAPQSDKFQRRPLQLDFFGPPITDPEEVRAWGGEPMPFRLRGQIAFHRRTNGFTQAQLAGLARVSRSHLGKVIRGKRRAGRTLVSALVGFAVNGVITPAFAVCQQGNRP
jgi:hypothetical protein